MLVRQPRDVPTRARKAGDESDPDWIGGVGHDDGDRPRHLLDNVHATGRDEDIDLESDKLLGQFEVLVQSPCRVSLLNEDVFPLDVSQLSQPLAKGSNPALF